MRYSFVNPTGKIIRHQSFDVAPIQPNPLKGKWLEDTKPDYDKDIHTIEMVKPIDTNLDAIVYIVSARDEEEILAEQEAILLQEVVQEEEKQIVKIKEKAIDLLIVMQCGDEDAKIVAKEKLDKLFKKSQKQDD